MGIQERAMLEYRRTMKKARGMAAVLGLCMAVAGTSVSYASASGNTGDSGYESSQEHTESDGADTGGSSFEAGDSLGGGSGGGSGGGGSPETGGDSGFSGVDSESGLSEAEGSSGDSGTEAETGGSEAEDSAGDSRENKKDENTESGNPSGESSTEAENSGDDKPAASSEETAFGAGQKENSQATGNVTGEDSDQAPEAGIADGGKAPETSETPASPQTPVSPEIQKQLSIPESTVTSEPEAAAGPAAASELEAEAGPAAASEPEAAAGPAAASEPEVAAGSEPEVAAGSEVAPEALQAAAPEALQAAAPATVQAAALAADATSTDTAITITGCDKVKISVNEGKQLEIYLNDSAYKTTYTNTTGITNLSIRAKDKISFKNDLASGKNWLLDLSQAIVELIAKQIELKPNEQVTLKVKQLTLQADDSNDSGSAREVFSNVVKKVYDSDTRYVGIRNMTIIADSGGGSSGSSTIVISASNTASSDADSTTAADGVSADTNIWQNVDSGVASLGSFLANVKNMETIVEIEDSSLTADSIKNDIRQHPEYEYEGNRHWRGSQCGKCIFRGSGKKQQSDFQNRQH